MTDIIVRILVEVLSVFALATKQIKQGRLSKCILANKYPPTQTWFREICEEVARGKGD